MRSSCWRNLSSKPIGGSFPGSGPEEARLRRSARELGLAAHVSFAVPAFGEDKLRLFAASDVPLLASYSEGLPYALLEGMAAGRSRDREACGGDPRRHHGRRARPARSRWRS
jgi:glycosyltransferase involved in cell wall biosynthesis